MALPPPTSSLPTPALHTRAPGIPSPRRRSTREPGARPCSTAPRASGSSPACGAPAGAVSTFSAARAGHFLRHARRPRLAIGVRHLQVMPPLARSLAPGMLLPRPHGLRQRRRGPPSDLPARAGGRSTWTPDAASAPRSFARGRERPDLSTGASTFHVEHVTGTPLHDEGSSFQLLVGCVCSRFVPRGTRARASIARCSGWQVQRPDPRARARSMRHSVPRGTRGRASIALRSRKLAQLPDAYGCARVMRHREPASRHSPGSSCSLRVRMPAHARCATAFHVEHASGPAPRCEAPSSATHDLSAHVRCATAFHVEHAGKPTSRCGPARRLQLPHWLSSRTHVASRSTWNTRACHRRAAGHGGGFSPRMRWAFACLTRRRVPRGTSRRVTTGLWSMHQVQPPDAHACACLMRHHVPRGTRSQASITLRCTRKASASGCAWSTHARCASPLHSHRASTSPPRGAPWSRQ